MSLRLDDEVAARDRVYKLVEAFLAFAAFAIHTAVDPFVGRPHLLRAYVADARIARENDGRDVGVSGFVRVHRLERDADEHVRAVARLIVSPPPVVVVETMTAIHLSLTIARMAHMSVRHRAPSIVIVAAIVGEGCGARGERAECEKCCEIIFHNAVIFPNAVMLETTRSILCVSKAVPNRLGAKIHKALSINVTLPIVENILRPV